MRELAALLILLLAGPALAHSWYDSECCSGSDCDEQKETKIEELADGYHLLGQVMPYSDKRIRLSPDKLFHVCTSSGSRRDGVYIHCLYVPGRGA